MSEFIAEASVSVVPDLTLFRARLIADLATATSGVMPPIGPSSGSGRRSGQAAAAETAARIAGDKAVMASAATRNANITKGFVRQGLAAAGLRGAVLAANSAFLAGTVAAVGFGKAVSSAANLESELNVFAITAGATAEQMERVSEEAQALGRDISLPGVTAGDAASAFTELAKAGLSVEDSLAGAKGVLQLATAAQIDNSQATIIAASALNAFGLGGDKAVHVADLLANAANASQGSISDMGLSLQQAAAVSRQVGVSLEDTVALLTLLAKNGIRGSDAGTSLRVAFTKLINPTDKAAEVLNRLNVNIRDAAGNVRPGVFNDFAAAQADLTRKEQDRNAGIVFGTDALRAYAIISREGLSGLDATRAVLDRQGSAAELAGARMSGLTGAAENLKNQLSGLGLTIGTVLIPPLTVMADTLAGAFSGINVGLGGIGKGVSAALDALNGQNLDLDPAAGSVRDLTQRLREVSDEAAEFKSKNEGGFFPPVFASDTKKLTAELVLLGKAVEATGSNNAMKSFLTQFMNASPHIARVFQDGFITPAEKAILATDALGRAFLKVVPDEVFSGLGAAARDGVEYARTVAGRGIDNMGAHVRSKIEDISRTAGESAASAGKNIGDKLAEGLASTVSNITNQLSGLGRAALDIDIEGGPNEQERRLRNLEQQEVEARAKVAARVRQRDAGTIGNEPVTAAKQELDKILDDQEQIREEMAAEVEKNRRDAETKAKEIQRGLDEADQTVLDAISDRSAIFDTRQITVDATPGLQDNIALARARKAFLTKQIEIARNSIKDDELLADTIRDLDDRRRRLTVTIDELLDEDVLSALGRRSAALDSRQIAVDATSGLQDNINLARRRKADLTEQIEVARTSIKDDELRRDTLRDLRDRRDRLTVEINDLVSQKGSESFTAKVSLAQALGNIPLQIRLIDQRTAELLKLVAARNRETGALKLVGRARDEALAEAANLATQREGLEDQRIQEGINLGQSILDLTKNKNPLLKALDRAVAETRKDIARVKKAGGSTVVLQTELNNFLKQRKEVLEGAADDAKRGPTAFDLLTQFSGIFGETAGNLIGGSQPFQTAGGINGFTADIASHLRRTGAGGKTLGGLAGKTKAERNILKLDDTAIVTAMNGLKDAFLGRSGPGTGNVPSRKPPGSGAIERNDMRWREAGRARASVEQRRSGI